MAVNRDPDLANLELSFDDMRSLTEMTVERVLEHLASLSSQPASGDVRAEALCRAMREAPPQLSLFGFHVTWPAATVEQENEATATLLDRVTTRGRVMLTGCTAGGGFLARVCVVSFRTRQDRIDACVEDVAQVTPELLAERP